MERRIFFNSDFEQLVISIPYVDAADFRAFQPDDLAQQGAFPEPLHQQHHRFSVSMSSLRHSAHGAVVFDPDREWRRWASGFTVNKRCGENRICDDDEKSTSPPHWW